MLVYDLGGGTFDATVIELADRRISVLAVEGDHQLGGADWDERIALHLSRRFCADNPDAEDPLDDSAGSQALVLAAERAKHQLTDAERTEVVVTHDGARATVPLSRAELEEMTAPLLRRTLDLTRACLDEAARRGVAQVDRVLLVGGSSRMPAVAELLRRELELDPQLHDPELAVARGAAIYGEKTELERMVAADLRSRGRLRDGAPLDDALPADLDAACRRVADAFGVALTQVRRAVEIRVDTVVSRGFGVLAVNAQLGRLEVSWLVHRNDRLPDPHQPLVRHGAGRPADHRGHGRRAAGPSRVGPRAGREGADRGGDHRHPARLRRGQRGARDVRDGVRRRAARHRVPRRRRPCRSCSPPPPAPRCRRPRWPASAISWGSSADVSRQPANCRPSTPTATARRVLAAVERRGGPDTSDPFELYDLPLDAELDDAAVAARVAEVWAFWQRQRDHPRYRALVALLVETHAARSAELLDADTRRGRRRQGARPPRGARAARYALLDAAISRLVQRHGGVPRDKVAGLEEVGALGGLTQDEVATRVRRHRMLGPSIGAERRQADPGAARRVRPADRGRSPAHAARAARARAVGDASSR